MSWEGDNTSLGGITWMNAWNWDAEISDSGPSLSTQSHASVLNNFTF